METIIKLATSRDLVDRINNAEHLVTGWFAARHDVDGQRRLRQARDSHSRFSVAAGGGMTPYLNTTQESSAKLAHNAHITMWEQTVVYGAAASSSGVVNTCAGSTVECRSGCLNKSGHLGMSNGQLAMSIRTNFLWAHPDDYLIVLLAETERHARRIHACGKMYAQRLNGTTDTPWEQCGWMLALLRSAGVDMHFDYTKLRGRKTGRDSDPLYYLARSATERTSYSNIRPLDVVVVDTKRGADLPSSWCGFDVIDGDHTNGDLRFLDAIYDNHVVLLRAKGKLRGVKGSANGFVKPSRPRRVVL